MWGQIFRFSACELGHVDIVHFLLSFHGNQARRVECDEGDFYGTSPLAKACSEGHEAIVKMLLEDARVDHVDEDGRTALWQADGAWDHVGVIKLMLASGRPLERNRRFTREELSEVEVARFLATAEHLVGSEEELAQQRERAQAVVELLQEFDSDPERVARSLSLELGLTEARAGELFALVVYLADGYLEISSQ